MIFNSKNVRAAEIELTTRCNAICPGCGRFEDGKFGVLDPGLVIRDITFEDFATIVPCEFLLQLESILFCGHRGDPIMNPHLQTILDAIHMASPEINLKISTNGGIRDADWWAHLARHFQKPGSYVLFALDGIGETHSLYRRNTKFETVLENAKTFMRNGGRARWQFIAFKHNEHQIEEARTMADHLGFEKFVLTKTGRNLSSYGKEVRHYARDRDGNELYPLDPPENPAYRNSNQELIDQIKRDYGSIGTYLDKTPIRCKSLAGQSIYISAEGYIAPCSKTMQLLPLHHMDRVGLGRLIDEAGGFDTINALKRPIAEIIDGPFFQAIADSWHKPSCAEGRVKSCPRHCGENNISTERK